MKTTLQLKDLELSLGTDHVEWDAMIQDAPALFEVEAEYEPGERAITNRAPEDCQPGWPASFKIHSIKPVDAVTFIGEISRTVINAKAELVERLRPGQIDMIADDVLKSMREDAYA